MRRLVQCVPNFSEGRDPKIVDQIVAAITSAGVTLLDREMDANHNRCVITFVGEPAAVAEAAFRGAKKAADLIDLTKHKGEHPRIGATDVVPFIPIAGVTMDECVALARQVAGRIASELGIPTYLYEKAATRPDRVGLENIRKGQFEGLREAIETDPDRAPDFGPKKIHPTAGATVVGARGPLIAYNIYLASNDLALAKEIAKSIRTSSGGFPCVKAMGMNIEDRGIVQVSMNLTNFEETSMFTVFEAVRQKAAARGVEVLSSEIVGLVPQRALTDVAMRYLKLENFSAEQILENKLAALERRSELAFLDSIAAPTPAPGGGSVAALSGACAAALGEMVAGITLKKAPSGELEELQTRCRALRTELTRAFSEDAAAFDAVMAAFKLLKSTDEEKARRRAAIEEATKNATRVPLSAARAGLETLRLLGKLSTLAGANVASDLIVAKQMAVAGIRGATANVRINLDSLQDAAFVAETRKEVSAVEKELRKFLDENDH
jgi:glutamate formiminotransferase/formiminotetrahydrofolate cyclodeaminase